MSRRKRQNKRKVKSRKNKQPAVTPKTDSSPQKREVRVEEKAQSNSTPTAPPKKNVITDPKSTLENNDSEKVLLDGELVNDKSDEVINNPTDEKLSLVQTANGSNGKGWLKTKKWGRRLIVSIEVLAAAFVIPAAYALIVDLEDRQSQRIAQAWGLVTQQASGNSGKIEALEYLNSDDCSKGTDDEPSKWEMFKKCSWVSPLVAPKRRVSLKGIDLSENTHKSKVFLDYVDLSGANLRGANFTGSSLRYAKFKGRTFLDEANFSKATLYDTDMSKAIISRADFTSTSLVAMSLIEAVSVLTNYSNAKITDSDLSNAGFGGSDFTDSKIYRSNFTGANFNGIFAADRFFGDPVLTENMSVTRRKKDIKAFTTFERSKIYNSDFSFAELHYSDLSGAWFHESNLSHADFSYADLSGAVFTSNIIKNTIFNDAIFKSHTPYKYVTDRRNLMGWRYEVLPWPIDAKSGAAYEHGKEPNADPSLLVHFTAFGEDCTWAPGLAYVECLRPL